ncbi:hypothetical protein FO519_007399 [Halicephalobus sp. NKZ332]|nr:hypothetical protein FO519_007399 [Halicephalobus sp. NKZ332]
MEEDKSPEELRIRNILCESSLDYLNSFNKADFKPLPPDFRVPLIKMYGILDNGEKCLANIHGVLPYFLLRTRSPFSEELKSHVGRIVVKCANLLNYKFIQGYPLLADVVPLELKDMYGFYENPDHFVKVIFYDIILCHRIGLTLQKECAKNELLQPYFTHIPYLLQFFIDYNIFGMGIVRFKKVKFRTFTEKTRDFLQKIECSNLPASSIMEAEFDVSEKDVITVDSPSAQSEYQCSGLEFIWREEQLRCHLTETTLPILQKPEIGVPVFENGREKNHFLQLKRILNTLETGNPESSQTHMNSQSPVFSQAEIQEDNPASVEEYIDSQSNREKQIQELDQIENFDFDEENDEKVQMAEMTQFIQDEEKEDDVIVIDDEPEVIDLTDLKEKDRFIEVEPDYPPVLLNPQVCLFSRQKSNQNTNLTKVVISKLLKNPY